ncbi:hypothetical protein HNP87_001836 [Methanococcus maripaludis]|uniref:Uncharacterized protein n=1 Tax=Methanococcus maripaludis TaxID=39152 RepID=A0A7J9NKR1_METMI|nr:hypothetical protein [Methanococcus maripaludis]MBA2841287.1 hypothetical protein [Methanococcus maripaludis]
MVKKEKIIRDFIYFDFEKAVSILSQFEGGMTNEILEEVSDHDSAKGGIKADLGILKAEINGNHGDNSKIIQKKVLHHAIFEKIEELIFKNNFGIDINSNLKDWEIARDDLKGYYYMRVEGQARFEDFNRLNFMFENINDIVEFMNEYSISVINDQLEDSEKKIKEYEYTLKQNRDKLHKEKKELADLKNHFKNQKNELFEKATHKKFDDWMIKGMNSIVSIFAKNRINLRIYPFGKSNDFHIISNLKKECFVDSDLENIMFAYGANPNVDISIFGLITSVPSKDEEELSALTQQAPSKNLDNLNDPKDESVKVENGFFELFKALEPFEKMFRFSRYPNVTVYPIAVYRKIGGKTDKK